MKTDKAWVRFGEIDPYYGVFSSPEYESHRLTDDARERFFRSGVEHIQKVLSTLKEMNPAFAPRRALDFGCGVGRLTLPLAQSSNSVLGVDIAPGMLVEARKNAIEFGVDNVTFAHLPEGKFDLVHSFIVLQHIAPRRGMRIVSDLLSRVEAGGMIVLQFPYHRDAPVWQKFATHVKRNQPVVNGVLNILRGKGFGYPAMTMFCYDVAPMLTLLRRSGVEAIRVTLEQPFRGYETLVLYGEKLRA